MNCKVLVFGGTTEGRVLADVLMRAKIPHKVSVATEYGRDILFDNGEKDLLVGRKDAEEIKEIIEEGGYSLVVDATHPFATKVSKEIKSACNESSTKYLRLKRDTGKEFSSEDMIIYRDSVKDAALELSKVEGNILLLTGSKELSEIAGFFPDKTRLFVRVLPNTDSIEKCLSAGFSGRQIIAMQGPFSRQMNVATIKEIGAKVILTKESGKAGGLEDKLFAALECGIKAVVIKNPEKESHALEGGSLEEVLSVISELTGKDLTVKKTITLAGMGPGGEKFFTNELERALSGADIIFGAEAVLKNLKGQDVPKIPLYKGDEIYAYLTENKGFMHPVILFSGDISLCSGAKSATVFFEEKGYAVNRISGISSVTLFAMRLRLSLEKVRIVNAHGKKTNIRDYILKNEEVIILTSDATGAVSICRDLADMKKSLQIIIGCELGCEGEKLIDLRKDTDGYKQVHGKCLVYVKNPDAPKSPSCPQISDAELIRGKTPMTKEEIRALSLRKLGLTKGAVIYDIGAGTGSVSVEAALSSPEINVFSIEKNEEAIALLTENKRKFGAENIEIIKGEAPFALKDLPAPSHVFIGGSGGNMKEILRSVFEKNDKAKVVINTVTAESFAEVMECVKEYRGVEPDIIQVAVSRFKKVGNYHMPDALNPVYITTLQKGDADDKA